MLAHLEDRHHVDVIDLRHRLRLPHEPSATDALVLPGRNPQQLDRHLPVELDIVRRIHDPHPARAQLREDGEVTDLIAAAWGADRWGELAGHGGQGNGLGGAARGTCPPTFPGRVLASVTHTCLSENFGPRVCCATPERALDGGLA